MTDARSSDREELPRGMPALDCALCHQKILNHQPRWIAGRSDAVCMDCLGTLIDDELNRRIDGQPSSLTQIIQESSLFAALQSENERLEGEIKAMGEMYKQVVDPLQECCQKYKLGLGGELCHELVIEELERLKETALTEKELRREWWLSHGCGFPALYGDDGEMSCNACMIDFGRWSPNDISARLANVRRISSTSEETDRDV